MITELFEDLDVRKRRPIRKRVSTLNILSPTEKLKAFTSPGPVIAGSK